ncbi:hypothetical protein EIP91_002033, partial [Steccherinum ochraceum]
ELETHLGGPASTLTLVRARMQSQGGPMADSPPHLIDPPVSSESALPELATSIEGELAPKIEVAPTPVRPEDLELLAIVLFKDQHPDWTSKPPRIFCKSNLDVLRNPATTDQTQSFPTFEQVPFGHKANLFEFSGYYRISGIKWLKPQSQELVDYLDKKFNPQPTSSGRSKGFWKQSTPRERSSESWRESLGREWAVVELKKDNTKKNSPF